MNQYIGSNFDEFLREEGIFEHCRAVAVKRVLAYHLLDFMEKNNLSKTAMSRKLQTSRAALDRLLDQNNTSITLDSMIKVAQITGKRLEINLL